MDIRAHLFQYTEANCHGTAQALERFGIGRQLPFASLLPGDFITMNRTNGSGHTAVFLSYLDGNCNELTIYSDAVAGYKYFSAQGKCSPDAGFAYRWAFFAPYCPAQQAGRRRDCGIIRSPNQSILNTGCMLHPQSWSVHPPSAYIESDANIDIELPPPDLSHFDGVTTD